MHVELIRYCAHLLCSSACQHCHRCRHCHLKFITDSALNGHRRNRRSGRGPSHSLSLCRAVTALYYYSWQVICYLCRLSLFWPYAINSFVPKWNCTFAWEFGSDPFIISTHTHTAHTHVLSTLCVCVCVCTQLVLVYLFYFPQHWRRNLICWLSFSPPPPLCVCVCISISVCH